VLVNYSLVFNVMPLLPLQALASTLDSSDIADLRDQFNAIDIDRNGTITLEEMREALQKDRPWTIKESRIVEILQAVSALLLLNSFERAQMYNSGTRGWDYNPGGNRLVYVKLLTWKMFGRQGAHSCGVLSPWVENSSMYNASVIQASDF